MRLYFSDYTILLLAELERKQAANELPLAFVNPTSAGIKGECEKICQRRFHKKDEQALIAFFGQAESQEQFLKAIKKLPNDKFKPLVNYLNKDTSKTDDKNIELLAWLIDFKHRPCGFGREVLLTEDELKTIDHDKKSQANNQTEKELHDDESTGEKRNEIPGEKTDSNSPINIAAIGGYQDMPMMLTRTDPRSAGLEPNQAGINNNRISTDASRGGADRVSSCADSKSRFGRSGIKNIVIAGLVLLIAFITIYFMIRDNTCMYWVVDHYEEISCDDETTDQEPVWVNKNRLKNFRKIPNDSITENSIGNVFYLKTDNIVECFNQPGKHPIHKTRSLRPLTATIYNKYIKK